MAYTLLKNCREIITVSSDSNDFLGIKNHFSLLINDEKIQKIGLYEDIAKEYNLSECTGLMEIDCSNHVILPGYIDCHTHLIYGKSRVDEYSAGLYMSPEEMKENIKRLGLEGSMYFTKNAKEEELKENSKIKLERMLKEGTTTVEIKSGYGIDKHTELLLLRIINELKKEVPQTILATYLGAHYWDTTMGKEKYIDFMIEEVMPVIGEEKLAEFIDVWVDEGYYTAEEAEKILKAGMRYNMKPTLHTECYSSIGGAKVAAKLKAPNVGHLNYITDEDIKLLSSNGVIGVLLPGTDFHVKHKKPFDARKMIDMGLEVALSTNLNPGNWIESIPLAMSLACRNHGMRIEEAIRAATIGGAKALRIDKDYGSLEEGKFADIQILKTDNYKNIVYKFGVNEIEKIIKKGKIIIDNKH